MISSVNPATEEVVQSYDVFDESQIEDALALSQLGFSFLNSKTIGQRAGMMLKAAAILDSDKERFASLMVSEMGKTFSSAVAEVEKCALVCRYYAGEAENILARHDVQIEGKDAYVLYQPLGAVLAVMPWNFPFWQVFRFAAPALMAGNVGLLKHASNVPGCAIAIEEVFARAGFAQGCFQSLLIGSDKVKGLIEDERVKAVTLTGSENAGRAVGAQAGHALKNVVLELGGSDPFIIMPSADLDKAVDDAVTARVMNNGQTCIAAKRYIVHAEIYDDVRDRLVEKYLALKVGDPMAQDTDVGPLATKQIRTELHDMVEETVALGAKKLCGAHKIDGAGFYYQPGILESVPDNSPAAEEELFGPVASLFKVENLDEAISLANGTRFGLGAAIYTQDQDEASRAVTDIVAGAVFVNAIVGSDPRLPFGGVKASGIGRELAGEGVKEFVNIKTVVAVK